MNIHKIFITGGTGDLGTALVREVLAKKDTHVVTNGRDQSKAELLRDVLTDEQKTRFHFIQADMNKETPEDIASRAYEKLGGIDMLISNLAVFNFDDVLEKSDTEMTQLYDTNMSALKLADAAVNLVTRKGMHLVLCDIGSTSVIADMLGKPFQNTMHYGKTKADVVRHSIELAHTNPLVTFRAVHPGSIAGKSAHQIKDKYGDTTVTTPQITARYTIDFFFKERSEKVLQSIYTSEKYFAWTAEGPWYNKKSEIAESIEGLTPEAIVTIPVDGINSFKISKEA